MFTLHLWNKIFILTQQYELIGKNKTKVKYFTRKRVIVSKTFVLYNTTNTFAQLSFGKYNWNNKKNMYKLKRS